MQKWEQHTATYSRDDAKQDLLAGEEGAAVVDKLRATYTTIGSLKSAISLVRSAILDELDKFHVGYRPLEGFEQEQGVMEFFEKTLRQQVDLQRNHRGNPEWSDEAEAALQQIHLLPPNLDSFHISKREQLSLKKKETARVLDKTSARVVIPNAHALLSAMIVMLQEASATTSFVQLVIPLAFASGRRICELLNGRSRFSPVAHAQACIFDGQAKKRGQDEAYQIPLLVPFPVFAHALQVLRSKQGCVADLSNKEIASKYDSLLHRGLKTLPKEFAPILSAVEKRKIHFFRSLYCAYVWDYYDCGATQNHVIMKVLGHATLEESHVYNCVKLEGSMVNSFGPLPQSDFFLGEEETDDE